jgi:hypothetical protein
MTTHEVLTGLSGSRYAYEIHASNASWNSVPCNYAFAMRGGLFPWHYLYFGETEDLRARLANHEKWAAAAALGATHIFAHVNQNALARLAEERDLIQTHNPRLNVQEKPGAGLFGLGLATRRASLLGGG